MNYDENRVWSPDWINEMTDVKTVVANMKKVGSNYVLSPNCESRLLADWMYRFALKIEDLTKEEIQK